MNFFHSKLGGPTDGQAMGKKNKLWEASGVVNFKNRIDNFHESRDSAVMMEIYTMNSFVTNCHEL